MQSLYIVINFYKNMFDAEKYKKMTEKEKFIFIRKERDMEIGNILHNTVMQHFEEDDYSLIPEMLSTIITILKT